MRYDDHYDEDWLERDTAAAEEEMWDYELGKYYERMPAEAYAVDNANFFEELHKLENLIREANQEETK